MAIEATWAEEGLVEHINTVRGGNDDDARVIVETVHLNENLVQSLLVFAASTTASIAFMGDGVDFVDEDN